MSQGAAVTGGQLSQAEELEKLAALREKGILSEEEFQQQKRRILEREAFVAPPPPPPPVRKGSVGKILLWVVLVLFAGVAGLFVLAAREADKRAMLRREISAQDYDNAHNWNVSPSFARDTRLRLDAISETCFQEAKRTWRYDVKRTEKGYRWSIINDWGTRKVEITGDDLSFQNAYGIWPQNSRYTCKFDLEKNTASVRVDDSK